MSGSVIEIQKVVVTASGEQFTNPGAFARHEYQKSIGKARTTVTIARMPKGKDE